MKNWEFYGSFSWMGFNSIKDTEPLRGDSLLFTTKSQGVPSTGLINFDGMNTEITLILKPISIFESWILDW